MKYLIIIFIACFVLSVTVNAQGDTIPKNHIAPAPLFRDPVTDGAADPVLIWNREEKKWWMLYSQRRANAEAPDVAFCYGTDIGIASGENNGQTWVYRGTLNLEFEPGRNTFWAPDIVYHDGVYLCLLCISKALEFTGAARQGWRIIPVKICGTGSLKVFLSYHQKR